MSDFKSFGDTPYITKLEMAITQKVHGSNGQIYIYKDDKGNLDLKVGNRTRWITLEDDSFWFAEFVYSQKEEFISKLGEGRHFGEWIGPRINAGEGLTERKFLLFNWRRWKDKELPVNVMCVPVLYIGKISLEEIDNAMEKLRIEGSALVKGYMKPEGVVVEIRDQFYKKVFLNEETGWYKAASLEKRKRENPYAHITVDHLLQPIRLEKLLSRDEKYVCDYPESLPLICKDYIVDLEKEEQLTGTEDEIKIMKRLLGGKLFPFIKSIINER